MTYPDEGPIDSTDKTAIAKHDVAVVAKEKEKKKAELQI